MIDYVPQMSDPSLNPKPLLAFSPRRILTVSGKSESPNRPASSEFPSSPCCSTCLANQNLQINLLANYLPGDSDSQALRAQADPVTSARVSVTNVVRCLKIYPPTSYPWNLATRSSAELVRPKFLNSSKLEITKSRHSH